MVCIVHLRQEWIFHSSGAEIVCCSLRSICPSRPPQNRGKRGDAPRQQESDEHRHRRYLHVSRETQTSAQRSTLRRRPLSLTASYDGWVMPANTYHTRVLTRRRVLRYETRPSCIGPGCLGASAAAAPSNDPRRREQPVARRRLGGRVLLLRARVRRRGARDALRRAATPRGSGALRAACAPCPPAGQGGAAAPRGAPLLGGADGAGTAGLHAAHHPAPPTLRRPDWPPAAALALRQKLPPPLRRPPRSSPHARARSAVALRPTRPPWGAC